jgi:FixJ family two-component response regulator
MSTNLNYRNVIVADDDPEMLLTVCALVSSAGYNAIATQNFDSFKKNYTDIPFVVMLDLTMVGKDSERIVGFLSSEKYEGSLIFITGANPQEISRRQQQADESGLAVVDVLIKPFWLDDVTRALKAIVPR